MTRGLSWLIYLPYIKFIRINLFSSSIIFKQLLSLLSSCWWSISMSIISLVSLLFTCIWLISGIIFFHSISSQLSFFSLSRGLINFYIWFGFFSFILRNGYFCFCPSTLFSPTNLELNLELVVVSVCKLCTNYIRIITERNYTNNWNDPFKIQDQVYQGRRK